MSRDGGRYDLSLQDVCNPLRAVRMIQNVLTHLPKGVRIRVRHIRLKPHNTHKIISPHVISLPQVLAYSRRHRACRRFCMKALGHRQDIGNAQNVRTTELESCIQVSAFAERNDPPIFFFHSRAKMSGVFSRADVIARKKKAVEDRIKQLESGLTGGTRERRVHGANPEGKLAYHAQDRELCKPRRGIVCRSRDAHSVPEEGDGEGGI